jgi:hypothetical protein
MTYIKSFILILVVLSMTLLNINIKSQAATRTETKTVNFGNPLANLYDFNLVTKEALVSSSPTNPYFFFEGGVAVDTFIKPYIDTSRGSLNEIPSSVVVSQKYTSNLDLDNNGIKTGLYLNNFTLESFSADYKNYLRDYEFRNKFINNRNLIKNFKVEKGLIKIGKTDDLLISDKDEFDINSNNSFVSLPKVIEKHNEDSDLTDKITIFAKLVSGINQDLKYYKAIKKLDINEMLDQTFKISKEMSLCNANTTITEDDKKEINYVTLKQGVTNIINYNDLKNKGTIKFNNRPNINTPVLIIQNNISDTRSYKGLELEDSKYIITNNYFDFGKYSSTKTSKYGSFITNATALQSGNGQIIADTILISGIGSSDFPKNGDNYFGHYPFSSTISCEISTQTEIKPSLTFEIKAANGTDTQTILSGDPAKLKFIYKNTGNEDLNINQGSMSNGSACNENPIIPGIIKVGQTIEKDCTLQGIKPGELKDNLLSYEVTGYGVESKVKIPMISDSTKILVSEPIKKIPKVTLDVRAPDGTDSQTITPGDPIKLKLTFKNTGNEVLNSPILQSYVRIPCKGAFDSFPSELKIGEVVESICTLEGVQPDWLTNNQVKIGLKARGIESNTFSEQFEDTSTVIFKPKLKIIPKSSPWYYFMKMLENNPEMYNRVVLFLNL